MGNHWGLGYHLIFVFSFVISSTYTCLGNQNTSGVCLEKERLALLKFKYSVKNGSRMLSSWVGNDCCRWEGIQCDSLTGTIESLHLTRCSGADEDYRSCYIAGNEVSSSLGELRHLKSLDLSGSLFEGSRIPKFIGSLKQLTYLNLSDVGFEGTIPPFIGNLSYLKVLNLSNNYNLVANDMAWTFGLSSLEHLDLSWVDLSGARNMDMLFSIPLLKELSLSNCGLSNSDLRPFLNSSRILPKIKYLDLSENSFKGPLPGFFQNMSSLSFLDLSSFNLSMTWNFANLLSNIPSLSELHLSDCSLDKTHLSSPHLNFSSLSNIRHLDLSQNLIGGVLPSVLKNMSSLKVLDVSENMLNSSVPVMPNLLVLDLSYNEFKQIEDVGIWRHCHLKELSAWGNQFEIKLINSTKNQSECSRYALEWLDLSGCSNGTIPESLGRLSSLRGIDLSRSRLTGPIPVSLGRLRYLEVLDLSSNQLTGPIPTFLGNLSTLFLHDNHLNGSIPESFGNLAALTDLDLSSNRLTGPIPASMGKLSKLVSLVINNNYLEGVVFNAHFANLLMLKKLDASFNSKLTFNVSNEWIPPFQLEVLHLRSCNITNAFPQWLRYQRNLGVLDLSNTTISGTLPTWWRKMPTIPYLILSDNNLRGPLTNLPTGETYELNEYTPVLLLQNNFFNESIPSSLCRRVDLKNLNLSKNKLTGKIPKCLGNLKGLSNMILSSNQLSGVIPRSIALDSLDRLKLNGNNFVGELPQKLGNLKLLSILDVGDNNLSGNIPDWVGENLTSLVVLRLHKNNFTGRIPHSLCKASSLQILDVAHNNLEGPIPDCLRELNAMVKDNGQSYSLFIYDDNAVQVVMKGLDLEYYTKNLQLVIHMDLSSNKLIGEIPAELTALAMLVGLNLSNNHLSGHIPDTIGDMKALNSLDLSGNELIGAIPPSMGDLTFLSHLNLSHNNLSGRIPSGSQLQTLIDPSIYEGNKDLCGAPLSTNCSNPTTTSKKKYEGADVNTELWLFYVVVVCGFATGFWGVIGVLLFKKQWRWNLFRFAEKMMDKIYVAVMVRVAKMKRGREAA